MKLKLSLFDYSLCVMMILQKNWLYTDFMSTLPNPDSSIQSTTYVSKILMLGESCVGKTSIVKRYSQDIFPQSNTLLTVGVDIRKVVKNIKDKTICLELWDTAGQEKYRTLPSMYFKNVQGIILVYDLTESASFQKIKSWIQKIDQNSCNIQNLALMVVGNKLDMQQERQVLTEQGQDFSKQQNMKFKQTSAKTGKNVEEMINQIMATIIDKNLLVQRSTRKQIYLKNYNEPKQSKDCC